MPAGSTLTLVPTVLPENVTNKNVTWNSSNPSVATVTNGIVTAISAYTTIITVTTEEGDLTATYTITVTQTQPGVSVTGVTLNQTTASLSVGGTVTLIPTVLPAKALAQTHKKRKKITKKS
jgi:uncharacterized protein YjdB